LLAGLPNVHLLEPAPYPEFVWLMDRSTLILTDSGGVQDKNLSQAGFARLGPILIIDSTGC